MGRVEGRERPVSVSAVLRRWRMLAAAGGALLIVVVVVVVTVLVVCRRHRRNSHRLAYYLRQVEIMFSSDLSVCLCATA